MTYEEKVMRSVIGGPVKGCISRQRSKLSDIIRVNAYSDIINAIGWSMFDWSGFPEEVAKTLTSDMIERAVNCGAAAVYKVPEETGSASAGMWVCTPVEWVGVRKADNTADDFLTWLPYGDYCINKKQLNGQYVIICNNFEQSSDYDFTEWTATMLNETDISEMQLIKWSRMTPIAKTLNDNNTGEIENILRRVYEGEPWAVMSDASKLITGQSATRDDVVLRLTDETAIERMHFLSEFHYELIRRICNLYNIPFHTTAKSAQNLESELHNTDIFSRMLPEKKLEWRRRALDDFKTVFGWDVSVKMGKLFEKENEVIENNIEATNPDAGNASESVDNAREEASESEGDTLPDEREGGKNE